MQSPRLSSNLGDVTYKQFKRTYPGGYVLNFSNCLSSTNDFSVKNYSNLYLTNKYKISDIINFDLSEIKANYIYGSLQLGLSYLQFSEIDPTPYSAIGQYQKHFDYGVPIFSDYQNDYTNLTVKFFDNNRCQIFYTKNYKKYFLCVDVNNTAVFVKESLLSFEKSTTNPQDLIYLYSNIDQSIVLFKKTNTSTLVFFKYGNSLTVSPIIIDDNYSYLSNSFKLSKKLYVNSKVSLNTSFITYDSSNNIDYNYSTFNLTNNLLLHRGYSNKYTDIIVLKNQLPQNDIFSTSNSLLTGTRIPSFSDKFREYSSIGGNVKEERSENLELNYVFYNKTYDIYPGPNEFVSPSSLYPFKSLNINDSKFISSGAFSYPTPEYADKVYHLSNDPKNYNNGQYLLCTWLSGSPTSIDKVWVDRYYYPDLIDKQEALSAKPLFNHTYDNKIEALIKSNSSISPALDVIKFFDKKSDLLFLPNEKYRYDRISPKSLPQINPSVTSCKDYSSIYPYNYFKDINKSGEITLSFEFDGNTSDWKVISNYNGISSGIAIIKTNETIEFNLNIYDSVNEFYDESDSSWFRHTISSNIALLKKNYIILSINTKTGQGYCYVNNNIISSFEIPKYQFTPKQLLYGDFYQIIDDKKINLLSTDIVNITNVFISKYFTAPDLAFTIPILNGSNKINNIVITLPCGMRNSTDNIDILQTVCGSAAFKSNDINIIVKNLNIDNQSIIDGVKDSITTNISKVLPSNTNITTVEFHNFK